MSATLLICEADICIIPYDVMHLNFKNTQERRNLAQYDKSLNNEATTRKVFLWRIQNVCNLFLLDF